MINALPLTIESLVAILLLLTILYCVRLNGQLKRLKADETALKATIAELVTATETAERAIAGLKVTVSEAGETLGERLQAAERFTAEIHRSTAAGAEVLHRLVQIADARPWLMGVQSKPQAKPAAPDPKAIVAAAEALAERARARSKLIAA
ncbi:MAG: DUF6468 domain-containing protein [Xanthobacteraceae bacterium]